MRISVLLMIFYCIFQASIAQSMPRFTIEGVTPAQRQLVAAQFTKAFSLLPPLMQTRLEQKEKFDHYQIKVMDLTSHVGAEINFKGELRISSRYLDKPEMVTRLIIHELSHVYDMLKILPPEILESASRCNGLRGHQPEESLPEVCSLYKGTETTVSTTPEFLDITGWYQTLNGNGDRLSETTFVYRSPDPYEMRSPREMFAVNMEYFLTDPEYKCRRPSLYRVLSKHFNYEPFKNSSCKDSLSFVDPQFTHGDKAIFNIDPARVYAIHYLLASPGGGFGSSWGHSMIRIVMCAPSRTQVGPECLKDVAFHFVLSFRAFAGTPEISNWDGLTGAYNSRLFFLPFAQIINEYNVEQLRDLRSYPLTLSREEIKAFLERAIEVHWSYENKYYFLSNNCAVETMNLFKTGLQRRSLMNARIQTPMSVLSVLQKNNLISNEINFSNLSQAKAQGYYFASYEEGLKFALDVIASYSQQKYSLLQWLNMTPLERRQLFTSKQPAKDQKRWAASFLYLERFLDKKITQIAYNTYMTTTADPTTEIGKQTQKYIESITKNISGMEELTSPASIAKIGYGIPAQGELDEVQKYLEQIQNQRMKNQANIDNLFQQLLQLNKVDADEIKLTRENINIFTQALAH